MVGWAVIGRLVYYFLSMLLQVLSHRLAPFLHHSLVSVAAVHSGVATDVTAHVTTPLLTPSPVTTVAALPTGSEGETFLTTLVGATGLILSPALQPIPACLVRRIVSSEFVEMRELLSDNIALHDQLEAIHGPLQALHTPGAMRAWMCEIPSLISWAYCFAAYVAVRTSDRTTRDMLAYMRLIIREAMCHGGPGWQDYDRAFRSQAAIDPSLRWNTLLPDLQASTMFGQGGGGGTFYTFCRGVDHMAAHCALNYLQHLLTTSQSSMAMENVAGAHTVTSRRLADSRARPPRPLVRICASWNQGACIYPGTCTYRHICATCRQSHRARNCLDTPADSPYRRNARPTVTTGGKRPAGT